MIEGILIINYYILKRCLPLKGSLMTKSLAKQYAFLGLLILMAIMFSYFWLKEEQAVISDKILIQTEDKQGLFPYLSTNLNLDSGQIYSIQFRLKSLVDYEIFFNDKPLYLRTVYEHIDISHSDLSIPFELKFSISNLPDPMYYNVYIVLQSDGGKNGFTIKPKYTSNLHAYRYGMLVALVAVLLLFALQWNKDFSIYGNKISGIIFFLLFCFVFQYFCRMLLYELSGVFNAYDTPIFWTVGKGIVNGTSPYTGLFEIKPPGIFILSALSFVIIAPYSPACKKRPFSKTIPGKREK
jgi:hypothetical protein